MCEVRREEGEKGKKEGEEEKRKGKEGEKREGRCVAESVRRTCMFSHRGHAVIMYV